MVATEIAEKFAANLTEKFANESEHAAKVFTVKPGRRYDKILQECVNGMSRSIHAFVERDTGAVYKAAGFNAPATGVRYRSTEKALEAADLYGGYLYR